jgi:quinolinate synthase
MADMASLEDVERAHAMARETLGKKVIPVAYMNTSSKVKAFCGREGGIICTSSNARRVFEWAFQRGEVILFIPDTHLGTNTANALGIQRKERAIFNPAFSTDQNRTYLNENTRVILWEGFCHVHTWFTAEDIRKARETHPEGRIVVHPECPENLIALSDYNGSTAFMHRFAREAPEGSTTLIGTEIHMVNFLRHHYGRGKTLLPLARSFCPNMYRINLQNLRDTLENLSNDQYLVRVDDEIKENARVALNRMLEVA